MVQLDLSCEKEQREGFLFEKLERWSYCYLRMGKTVKSVFWGRTIGN